MDRGDRYSRSTLFGKRSMALVGDIVSTYKWQLWGDSSFQIFQGRISKIVSPADIKLVIDHLASFRDKRHFGPFVLAYCNYFYSVTNEGETGVMRIGRPTYLPSCRRYVDICARYYLGRYLLRNPMPGQTFSRENK